MERTAGEVYERLAPAVVGYFRSRGFGHAEDLAGDVFVRVAEGLARFRGDEAALRRWVFTIAHHRMVDEVRTRARRRETVVAAVPDVPTIGALDADAGDPELLAALATLTDDQREVVVLRFVADLPIRDVATIVGRRPGAVKMLQARGLEALRQALEPDRG